MWAIKKEAEEAWFVKDLTAIIKFFLQIIWKKILLQQFVSLKIIIPFEWLKEL